AMIWMAQDDSASAPRHFESQFLKIKNPFHDERLREWTGYTQTWNLDGRQAAMIPLSLYSLDYPGIPLRLIDFRHAASPGRAEMTLRFADDLTVGVFGLTGYGLEKLAYAGVKSSWLFVKKRHGVA